MKKIFLVIEKAGSGFLGRVLYKQNLIVDEAETLAKLAINIKKTLNEFHNIRPEEVQFVYKYDISALFEIFDYLKISNVAEFADVNASLLRQYVTGQKQASANQAKKIEDAIHKIGKELLSVKIYSK